RPARSGGRAGCGRSPEARWARAVRVAAPTVPVGARWRVLSVRVELAGPAVGHPQQEGEHRNRHEHEEQLVPAALVGDDEGEGRAHRSSSAPAATDTAQRAATAQVTVIAPRADRAARAVQWVRTTAATWPRPRAAICTQDTQASWARP